MQHQITVYDFDKKDDNRYFIDAFGIEPFFVMEFCLDNVIVEWEKYKNKAWYELHRQYQYETTLVTPQGEQTIKVHIICHDEDVYFKGELEKAPIVSVGIKYDGKELWGHGKDYFWIDAFADLQKQLPNGILLKCCLTCRHGNMSPVGNNLNELFCTNDIAITQKSDLYFCTEDENE